MFVHVLSHISQRINLYLGEKERKKNNLSQTHASLAYIDKDYFSELLNKQ